MSVDVKCDCGYGLKQQIMLADSLVSRPPPPEDPGTEQLVFRLVDDPLYLPSGAILKLPLRQRSIESDTYI